MIVIRVLARVENHRTCTEVRGPSSLVQMSIPGALLGVDGTTRHPQLLTASTAALRTKAVMIVAMAVAARNLLAVLTVAN